ncbi:hypothetical protein LSH36_264g01043 [Paralvinella palmiformis]|uniref:Uncharacterized protein n=1 Tax=Paralvinella palmiformis TaxID=53620 RepID=A0AAD9N2R2_9ANNE|nr:hypothetical protein LSH36_264g01043 [Paralvinella palmiformis]
MDEKRSRINCSSVNAIKKIEEAVISSVSSVIDKNIIWDDSEKERVREHFKDIFSTTFHEQIMVDGKAWSAAQEDGDSTQDMEPLDQEKKKYLNEVIYPNLNTQLVETTKLRQHLPYRCAQKHSRKCHFECQYLDKVRVELPVENLMQSEKLNEEDLLSEVLTSASCTRKIIEDLPAAEERASEIITVLMPQVDL